MSAMALEAQKASLARDILCMEDEATIHEALNYFIFLKSKPVETTAPRRMSIRNARGIFRDLQGMDTTFEREEEDRI